MTCLYLWLKKIIISFHFCLVHAKKLGKPPGFNFKTIKLLETVNGNCCGCSGLISYKHVVKLI